jgi:hypothetical protein
MDISEDSSFKSMFIIDFFILLNIIKTQQKLNFVSFFMQLKNSWYITAILKL